MNKNMKKNILVFAIALLVTVSGFAQVVLPVQEVEQEQDQWCWAGVSEAILEFFGVNITQTTIAAYGTDGVNTWNYLYSFSTSPLRRGINMILDNWGIPNIYGNYTLTYNDSVDEITNGNPYIIRWGWDSGGGHFIVCRGVDSSGGVNTLYLMDPWFNEGYSIADYQWVLRGGTHTWTHTLQTRPNQTPSPTQTPITPTPTPSGDCSCPDHITSTISITPGFTMEGSGEYCFETTNLGSYINSWNLEVLEINGYDYTNTWLPSSQYPSPIGGKYYVYYKSSNWGYFEVN